jgi:putative DNA-invertase from lambdoid prophage Rac
MTTFAYIRVSTLGKGQTTENQRQQITSAGFTVDQFFSEDGISGTIKALERPAFLEMMATANEGDTCIVTAVDRLGRNASDVLHTVEEFKRIGVKLRVLQFDGVDITSSMGKMLVTLMAAFAELERNCIVERVQAGLARTVAEGTVLGPKLVIPPSTLKVMCRGREMKVTLDVLSSTHGYDRNTILRNVKKWRSKLEEYENIYLQQQKQAA